MPSETPLPVSFDRSSLYFAMLFVGGCLLLTSVGLWFAHADMDYHFSYSHVQEDPPQDTLVTYYDQLSPEQKKVFHGAVDDGTSYGLESPDRLPERSVVKYQDKYYVFERYGYYDWFNPWTGGPVLLGLVGMAVMVDAARRDVNHRRF